MFKVDESRCTGCGKCIDVCPQGAITMAGNRAVIDENKCTDCGACVQVCPVSAIYPEAQPGQNIPPAQGGGFPETGIRPGGEMGGGTGRGMGRGSGRGLGRGPRDGRGGGRGGGGRRR